MAKRSRAGSRHVRGILKKSTGNLVLKRSSRYPRQVRFAPSTKQHDGEYPKTVSQSVEESKSQHENLPDATVPDEAETQSVTSTISSDDHDEDPEILARKSSEIGSKRSAHTNAVQPSCGSASPAASVTSLTYATHESETSKTPLTRRLKSAASQNEKSRGIKQKHRAKKIVKTFSRPSRSKSCTSVSSKEVMKAVAEAKASRESETSITPSTRRLKSAASQNEKSRGIKQKHRAKKIVKTFSKPSRSKSCTSAVPDFQITPVGSNGTDGTSGFPDDIEMTDATISKEPSSAVPFATASPDSQSPAISCTSAVPDSCSTPVSSKDSDDAKSVEASPGSASPVVSGTLDCPAADFTTATSDPHAVVPEFSVTSGTSAEPDLSNPTNNANPDIEPF